MSRTRIVGVARICIKFVTATLVTAALFGGAYTAKATEQPFSAVASALNLSTPTSCAEDDNVNVPISDASVRHFVITATHPTYAVGTDNCSANFTNCTSGESGYPSSLAAGVFKLYDKNDVVVEAVREREWWLPSGGMLASVDSGAAVTEIHYIRIYRKIADASEWPQFFVLYADGNARLIPHPPAGRSQVCFGSSVIVGPAAVGLRPFAEIAAVNYLSAFKTLEINYRSGGSASLDLKNVDRTMARVGVTIDYPTNVPFTTLRSMFVQAGNADTTHVKWQDLAGADSDDPIMTFPGGASQGWLFRRSLLSIHNTSAPDIGIRVDAPRLDTVAVDLNAYGIWLRQSDGTWTKLHSLTAVQLVAADLDGNGTTDQVINFGSPHGLWVFMNNKTWVKLHSLSPALMAAANLDGNAQQDLVVDFARYGIWIWVNNQTWVKLHDQPARSITAVDLDGDGRDEVAVGFESQGLWVWRNDQGWRQLHTVSPSLVTAAYLDYNAQRDLVVDFTPYGIWKWMNNETWVKIQDLPATSITAVDLDGNGQDELAIAFRDYGLWVWTNNQSGRQLHARSPALVTAAYLDDNRQQDLVVDFAPYGIWEWANDLKWVQLHFLPAKSVVGVQE